jgi:hypothetical protein
VFSYLKKMNRQEQSMTDSLWEFPFVLFTSAATFMSVWHFVALFLR